MYWCSFPQYVGWMLLQGQAEGQYRASWWEGICVSYNQLNKHDVSNTNLCSNLAILLWNLHQCASYILLRASCETSTPGLRLMGTADSSLPISTPRACLGRMLWWTSAWRSRRTVNSVATLLYVVLNLAHAVIVTQQATADAAMSLSEACHKYCR